MSDEQEIQCILNHIEKEVQNILNCATVKIKSILCNRCPQALNLDARSIYEKLNQLKDEIVGLPLQTALGNGRSSRLGDPELRNAIKLLGSKISGIREEVKRLRCDPCQPPCPPSCQPPCPPQCLPPCSPSQCLPQCPPQCLPPCPPSCPQPPLPCPPPCVPICEPPKLRQDIQCLTQKLDSLCCDFGTMKQKFDCITKNAVRPLSPDPCCDPCPDPCDPCPDDTCDDPCEDRITTKVKNLACKVENMQSTLCQLSKSANDPHSINSVQLNNQLKCGIKKLSEKVCCMSMVISKLNESNNEQHCPPPHRRKRLQDLFDKYDDDCSSDSSDSCDDSCDDAFCDPCRRVYCRNRSCCPQSPNRNDCRPKRYADKCRTKPYDLCCPPPWDPCCPPPRDPCCPPPRDPCCPPPRDACCPPPRDACCPPPRDPCCPPPRDPCCPPPRDPCCPSPRDPCCPSSRDRCQPSGADLERDEMKEFCGLAKKISCLRSDLSKMLCSKNQQKLNVDQLALVVAKIKRQICELALAMTGDNLRGKQGDTSEKQSKRDKTFHRLCTPCADPHRLEQDVKDIYCRIKDMKRQMETEIGYEAQPKNQSSHIVTLRQDVEKLLTDMKRIQGELGGITAQAMDVKENVANITGRALEIQQQTQRRQSVPVSGSHLQIPASHASNIRPAIGRSGSARTVEQIRPSRREQKLTAVQQDLPDHPDVDATESVGTVGVPLLDS